MAAPLRPLPHDVPADPPVVQEAVEALAAGGLVALPTETVYGLAARADDPAALTRLAELKGRDPARAFTWHLDEGAALLGSGARPQAVLRRLAGRYWPGPVTLVVQPPVDPRDRLREIAKDGWIGARVPAHEGTRQVLAACDFPVVASSANTSGEAPLLTAADVAAAFADDLALVLDGGAARLGEASAVLAVGPGRFEVLREGVVDAEDLRRTAGRSLLFVCTGNTCRSPMAETLARDLLARRLEADPAAFGFTVGSAGVSAGNGAPASEQAVEVMAARGLDLGGHGSRTARADLVAGADHVYCLTSAHRDLLVHALPPGAAEHVELLDPDGRDVPDPFGAPVPVYAACAEAMLEMLEHRADDWA